MGSKKRSATFAAILSSLLFGFVSRPIPGLWRSRAPIHDDLDVPPKLLPPVPPVPRSLGIGRLFWLSEHGSPSAGAAHRFRRLVVQVQGDRMSGERAVEEV